MRTIEKKVWPEFYEQILSGAKTFDARIADFECEAGDVLLLREWNPETECYTERCMTKRISHVLRTHEVTFWEAEDVDRYGLVIMSLK